MNRKPIVQVNDAFPQRKRIAHQSRDQVKGSSSKSVAQIHSKAPKELEVLKQFDLTLEFGPCIGISRMERWQRAQNFGLNPPVEVRDIINQHSDDEIYTQCLWNDYSSLK
ncbi:DNA polymerase delta subunit 4 [Aplysia californica]|uniref:DNA polymerase delta subunit 4 n=1 Tax=Aplysia californica TaxID=6500 RepID=A0ABM0JJB1_APLCA|nr:DNA polymerase delta subunit 4 [Aplysia californica]XP_035824740.1 DNA polymerase delta subunit 4 [Aplysia californica]